MEYIWIVVPYFWSNNITNPPLPPPMFLFTLKKITVNLFHHLIFQNVRMEVNMTACHHFDRPAINVWPLLHLSARFQPDRWRKSLFSGHTSAHGLVWVLIRPVTKRGLSPLELQSARFWPLTNIYTIHCWKDTLHINIHSSQNKYSCKDALYGVGKIDAIMATYQNNLRESRNHKWFYKKPSL